MTEVFTDQPGFTMLSSPVPPDGEEVATPAPPSVKKVAPAVKKKPKKKQEMKNTFPLRKTVVPGVLLLLLAAGCSTVKRYRHIDKTVREMAVDESDQPNYDESRMKVTMRMSDVKIEPEEKKPSFKSLWDLQGQGQRQLIQAFDTRLKDNDKFSGSLAAKYLKSDDKVEQTVDLTKRKVKFVFTIQRWHPFERLGWQGSDFSLADRIEYIRYSLVLNDSKLHFLNWNRYSTEYGSVNIADVSFQQSLAVDVGIGDTTTGFGASVSGSASRTENQHIQYRYIQLNGSLDRDRLDLESEGTREIDLSGNVVADVTMQFDPLEMPVFSIPNLTKDTGGFNPPKDVKVIPIHAKIPSVEQAGKMTGTLTYTYAYRHVVKNAKTFYEFDDRVQYYTGKVTKKVNVLSLEDVMPAYFGIIPLGAAMTDPNKRLKIEDPTGAAGFTIADLVFQDEQSANDFLDWLTKYPLDKTDPDAEKADIVFKNGMRLQFAGKPLNSGDREETHHRQNPIHRRQVFPERGNGRRACRSAG